MWKTRAGQCIYQSSTGIRVFQNLFFRWLQFDSTALQTVLNRYFPHRPGLHYLAPLVLPVKLNPADCCMLGLGGGGAAHALSPLLTNFQLTIVEASAEVIDVARRYFMIDQLKTLNLIHQDANLFVQQCKKQFQYILVDLFNADSFPAHCNTDTFFSNCKRLLKPGGLLVVNLANKNEQWPVFKLVEKQFPDSTIVLPVPDCSNMIIFAQNGLISAFLAQLKTHKIMSQLMWDSKWKYIAQFKT
ncbi:spermidine synthase [Legionella fairfieldensis]|uniref:spermidine synthase n=1 Tax=Legionella fairfieldensis TaxID=45064 RepID=UPI00048F49AA|nr:fused MFS/spermidine synthase [Legionella fairfieldensis]